MDQGIPRRRPEPELLHAFDRDTHRFLIELRDFGSRGIEVFLYQDDEFVRSLRFTTRDMAEEWANEQRKAIETGGGG